MKSGTNKNPFSYGLRKDILLSVFGDKVKVFPLPDLGIGNVPAWGDYVLESVRERFGKYPDILISGKESRRIDWFDNAKELAISELYVPKSIDISASEVREMFIKDDRKEWESHVNPVIHKRYDELREIVLNSHDNLNTESV